MPFVADLLDARHTIIRDNLVADAVEIDLLSTPKTWEGVSGQVESTCEEAGAEHGRDDCANFERMRGFVQDWSAVRFPPGFLGLARKSI